jgi:AcrR family transcriptional regulator
VNRAPLTVDTIVAAAWELSHGGDAATVSLRDLGSALGVHPTAIYRHFRDKHELMSAVADRTLQGVAEAADGIDDPVAGLVAIMQALRATMLAHPAAARVLAEGPTRRSNEVALTERTLALLHALGLRDDDVVEGYHALIELTVGSSVIDATVHALPDAEREETYRRWRADYLGLDADRYPHLVELAPRMYGHAAGDFSFGLDLLLDALARRAAS